MPSLKSVFNLWQRFQAADELLGFDELDPSIRGEFFERYHALGRTIRGEHGVNPLGFIGSEEASELRLGPRSRARYQGLIRWLAVTKFMAKS